MGARGKTTLFSRGYTGLDEPAKASRPFIVLPSKGAKTPVTLIHDYMPYAGLEWWTARSIHTVAQLARLFDSGNLPCMLYEHVGAMYPAGRSQRGGNLIVLQLVPAEDDFTAELLDLCFEEAGIYFEEQVSPPMEILSLEGLLPSE